MKSKIMYLESKTELAGGAARIGRITFSKSGRTIYCKNKRFRSLEGRGFKSNYYDVDTGEEYWISGCKRNGQDRLYGERVPVMIDEDVRQAYWELIRKQPENKRKRLA